MNIIKKIYCRSFQFIMRIAIPFLPYRLPKILETLEEIPQIFLEHQIDRVFVVTDKTIIVNRLLDDLFSAFQSNKMEYIIYDKTLPNPTINQVEEARKLYIEKGCLGILVCGGGSAIDLAKAMGARIARPKKTISKMKGLLHVHKKLPLFIAVPTTAGTGSEVTLASVIVDESTRHKYAINDFSLIPHYAVLDPKLTLTLPKEITATTGMDALTHAIEAFIGKSRTRQTKKASILATQLIVKHLKNCYVDSNSIEDRKGMLYAAHYAGIAFTKSYVGYIHAVAHSLGGFYHIPHGYANAVLLPILLEKYGKSIAKKIAVLAKSSGIAFLEDNKVVATKKMIEWIYQMNESMGIGKRIPEIKLVDIPQMAKYADQEANPLYPVPILMDKKELKKLYYKVME